MIQEYAEAFPRPSFVRRSSVAIAALRPRPVADSATIAGLVLLFGVCLVFIAFWPGVIFGDNAQIVWEARHHIALDWWTGVGTLALQGWFNAGLGTSLLWALTVTLTVVGLFGCLRLAFRRVPAACVTASICVWPTSLTQLSALSRDSMFVGFTLLAFASVAMVIRNGGRHRRAWYAVAFVCASLATMSRQNGLAIVFAITLWWIVGGRLRTRRRVALGSTVALIASLAVYTGLHMIGAANGVRTVHPERATYVYDLASISTITGHDYFPQKQLAALPPGGVTQRDLSEATLRRNFKIQAVSSLGAVPRASKLQIANASVAARETKILRHAWMTAIVQQPIAYAWDRIRLMASRIGILPHVKIVGYDAPPPFESEWIYLIALALAAVYLRRRRAIASRLVSVMVLALVANEAVLFFATMGSAFRYAFLTPLIAFMTVAYAAGVWLQERNRGAGILETVSVGDGQRGDGERCDPLFAPDEPHPLTARRLDVHAGDVDGETLDELRPDLVSDWSELGAFEYDGGIDIYDPIAVGAEHSDHDAQ